MRRHWLRMMAGAAVLALTVIALSASPRIVAPAAATSTQVGFSPSPAAVPVGAGANVDITVAKVSNLGGYDVFVQFNPAIVRMTGLVDAGFVTGGGNIVACNPATIDNVAGTATTSCATISPFGTPGPGVATAGSTALLRASFEGVGGGVSPLTLTGTQLQNPSGSPIPATLNSSSIHASLGVGGVAEAPAVGGPAVDAEAGERGGPPSFLSLLLLALLAVVVGGAGMAAAARRRR